MGDKPSRKAALERLAYAEKVTDIFAKNSDAAVTKLLKFKPKMNTPQDQILNILKDAQIARMNTAVLAEVFLFKAGSEVLHKDYPRGSIHFRNA